MTVLFNNFFSSESHYNIDPLKVEQLKKKALKIESIRELIEKASEQGYSFGGDTDNTSKACTDIQTKKIYIRKDKSLDETLLSLTYELINANNAPRIQAINDKYLSDIIPDNKRSEEYAKQILLVEAEAVRARSDMAIKLGLEKLIKNPKYLQFARDPDLKKSIQKIHKEMIDKGTVHNGKIKALDHYMKEYLKRVNLNYIQCRFFFTASTLA